MNQAGPAVLLDRASELTEVRIESDGHEIQDGSSMDPELM
jgi:hypothetical protein